MWRPRKNKQPRKPSGKPETNRREASPVGKAPLKRPKPARRTNAQATSPEETTDRCQEYERTRNQTAERQEAQRRYAQEKRERQKSLGLCVTCASPPIPGKTRCVTCASNRRRHHGQAKAKALQQRIQDSGQSTFFN